MRNRPSLRAPFTVIADLIRNPEGRGRGHDIKTKQPTKSPSPLMGEESKARVNKINQHRPVILP